MFAPRWLNCFYLGAGEEKHINVPPGPIRRAATASHAAGRCTFGVEGVCNCSPETSCQ